MYLEIISPLNASVTLDEAKKLTIFDPMKRMYVTLLIIFLVFLWAAVGLGQKIITTEQVPQGFDRAKRRMELREEMHKRMRDKILHGIGPDQDLFQDMGQMFEDSMGDIGETQHFEMNWVESPEGRTLTVIPKDKKQQLDIDVRQGAVTIKGKVEKKLTNGTSVSNFSNMVSIPEDCDETKVKMDQKEGRILITFPFKEIKKVIIPKIPDRRPLSPSGEDVAI